MLQEHQVYLEPGNLGHLEWMQFLTNLVYQENPAQVYPVRLATSRVQMVICLAHQVLEEYRVLYQENRLLQRSLNLKQTMRILKFKLPFSK